MKLKLPQKVNFIIDLLRRNDHEAFAVGGCVRDLILARDPGDFDITTSATPDEVKKIFRRTIDTGIEHGTVTVLMQGEAFEVTTYRVDGAYKDGRHPDSVTFTPSLKEDLKRRDFTINAMAYNEKLGLVDIYGGMKDLQTKTIRCVGDPNERFSEDALRIMRAVRFAAQLGFTIDPATREAIAGHAEELRNVSAERIQIELMKLLVSDHPMMFRDFYDLGVSKIFLPEFDRCMRTPQNTPHHLYNVGEHMLHSIPVVPPDRILRLTMLLHDIGKPDKRTVDENGRDHFRGHALHGSVLVKDVLKRLKFDNETIDKVTRLVRYHDHRPEPNDASVRKMICMIGKDLFPEYLTVQWADTVAKSTYKQDIKFDRIRAVNEVYLRILGRGDPLSIRELAINGNDLKEIGAKGEEIGELLRASLETVLEDPARNTHDFLMDFVRFRHSTG